jgi:hypothetical protein
MAAKRTGTVFPEELAWWRDTDPERWVSATRDAAAQDGGVKYRVEAPYGSERKAV